MRASFYTRISKRLLAPLRRLQNCRLGRRFPERRLIVVGSGIKAFRGYILEGIYRAGFAITLVSDAPLTWEGPFVEQLVLVDFLKPDEVVKKVERRAKKAPFAGILTYVETNVNVTAEISKQLDLRFYTPEVAHVVRDKFAMRQCLAKAGLIVPSYVNVTLSELKAAVAKVGTPCVIKPRSGEGSIGVIKVENQGESFAAATAILEKSLSQKSWKYGSDVLVEEYISGPEYSVESVVALGQIHHAAITEKFKSREPYFEEVSHTVPAPLAISDREMILDTVSKAIHALGIDNCGVHSEIKLSPKGPTLIEVGGRLAGGRIPFLVEAALGIDLPALSARAATGLPVVMQPQKEMIASIGFFVPSRTQVQPRGLVGSPVFHGIIDFVFWGEPGKSIGAPPEAFLSRLGYVIAEASTYEESRQLIEDVRVWVSGQTGLDLEAFEVRSTGARPPA